MKRVSARTERRRPEGQTLMPGTAARDIIRRVRAHGARDISQRVVRRVTRDLSDMFDTAALDFPLFRHDIADSTKITLRPPVPGAPKKALELAWICTPPGPGSGGHTTLFRMVSGLEERGHKCTLLLYNRHSSDLSRVTADIRKHWPWMKASIAAVPSVIDGFDGCVASSWETAHVLASRSSASAVHRFYFIQDFEPFFYPRGSLYSLAEDSYRLGLHNIALGNMVAELLQENVGAPAAHVPFGCDGETYVLENYGARNGVVFYARDKVDRRGSLLGKLALEEFHHRHPEQPIHVYGDALRAWNVPHTHHGKLLPSELNHLYNSCITGLALSFTNISLVAEEMLSCGMTPVVNDHVYARKDLTAPGIRWAPATPSGIADVLCQVVETPGTAAHAAQLAGSAHKNWRPAQVATASIIEEGIAECRQ